MKRPEYYGLQDLEQEQRARRCQLMSAVILVHPAHLKAAKKTGVEIPSQVVASEHMPKAK